MIAETTLQDHGFPLAIGHFVVNRPADRQGYAAEDQQRRKGLEDQANYPRVHQISIAGGNHAA